MKRKLVCIGLVLAVVGLANLGQAQIRLIGITGNQEANPTADETLYNVSLTNAATSTIMSLTHIPDTDSIGYNPVNGLVYHLNGNESYSSNPSSNGFRDNQYMETVNLDSNQITAIFNSNPPPSPDTAQAFGLPAPRPDWVLPVDIRRDFQTDDSFRIRGPNEYHGLRGVTWSAAERVFYGADEAGIFTLSPAGDSIFVGQPQTEPNQSKGIAFAHVGGSNKLYIGSKNSPFLYEIDPLTGQEIGLGVEVMVPTVPGGGVLQSANKLLALATHPGTGELYGISEASFDPFDRELIKINPVTGISELIGQLRSPGFDSAFSSMAFVGFQQLACDFDLSNTCTIADLDALAMEASMGGTSPLYDLNADGVVNIADADQWRSSAGAVNIGPGRSYLPGDADLSGAVDGTDFGVWNANKFTNTGKWSKGDFNVSGATDGSDFSIWNANKFLSSDGAQVPEPVTALWGLVGAGLLSVLRRRG